jgi:hypothetical protein
MTIYTKINHWTGTREFCINRIKSNKALWEMMIVMILYGSEVMKQRLRIRVMRRLFSPLWWLYWIELSIPDSWWQFCMGHMFFVFFNSLTTMPVGGFYGTFNPSSLIRAAACSKEIWAKILTLTEERSDPESNQIIEFNRFSFKDHHCTDREQNCKA